MGGCTDISYQWLVKAESDFIVRLVETGLGRRIVVVAMIRVDAYPFFVFLRPDLLS